MSRLNCEGSETQLIDCYHRMSCTSYTNIGSGINVLGLICGAVTPRPPPPPSPPPLPPGVIAEGALRLDLGGKVSTAALDALLKLKADRKFTEAHADVLKEARMSLEGQVDNLNAQVEQLGAGLAHLQKSASRRPCAPPAAEIEPGLCCMGTGAGSEAGGARSVKGKSRQRGRVWHERVVHRERRLGRLGRRARAKANQRILSRAVVLLACLLALPHS